MKLEYLITIGIIIVVASEILYTLTKIWEIHWGSCIGMVCVLIGIIYIGLVMTKETKVK